jgi:hypothetical protein
MALERKMAAMINLQFEQKQVVLSFPQELLAMDYVQAFLERLKLESLLEKTPEKLSTADTPSFIEHLLSMPCDDGEFERVDVQLRDFE